MLTFEPITLDRQNQYNCLLAKCEELTSDISFVNIWSWRDEYRLQWAFFEELVWLRQEHPQRCYWPPVGDWGKVAWRDTLKHFGPETVFVRIPEKLIAHWRKQGLEFEIEDGRDQWDYIYDIQELIQLKGNRFHKKKNLVNQFKKKYAYQTQPLQGDQVEKALNMQVDWCVWRDCESVETLKAENHVIEKVLNHWRELQGVFGLVVVVDDRIAGYTVAEELTSDTILIHFEKGDSNFKGVYQAVNQLLLAQYGDRFRWVNREQDLGDKGLRKAKLSYQPVSFIKKYGVRIHL